MAALLATSGLMDSFMGKKLEPVYAVINDTAVKYDEQFALLKPLFCEHNSQNFAESIVSESGLGDFVPTAEGADYPKGTYAGEGYSSTFLHREWKNSFELSETLFEDNKTSEIRKRAGLFTNSLLSTKEKHRAVLLSGGKDDTVTVTYNVGGTTVTATFSTCSADGVSLFNTEHPCKFSEDTQSNCFADEFSNESLGRISTEMQNFKNDKGDLVDVVPDTIIIPNNYALKQAVFAAIGADKDPDTSNNGFNYLFGTWRVICSPLLTRYLQPTEYIIGASGYNEAAEGAVWFDRIKMKSRTFQAEGTGNFVMQGRARWSAGFNDWRAYALGGTSEGTVLKPVTGGGTGDGSGDGSGGDVN
jgi:hypothetical protein